MVEVDKVITLLKQTFPESTFYEVKSEWIATVEEKYPNIPENLKYLYQHLGYGGVGASRYSIHVLLSPDEIYDKETADKLHGKLIVGDDFGGFCDAYDAENNWAFGYIDSGGEFEVTAMYKDFIDFLEQMAQDKNALGQ